MNYIFFALIIFVISLNFINKKSNISIISMLMILVFLIIKYPKVCVSSANSGINLWIFVVLPSLIPFFIINDMLISLKVPENISRLFAPIARFFFNTSGYGAYVFIMSIFSGYPSGGKITCDLIENKKINHLEGQKILTFSSTSGPLFIIGVVGASMLKSTSVGYLLILSHISGAIINGIVFGFFLGRDNAPNTPNSKIEKTDFSKKSLSEMLTNAILNSLFTSGLIGGYIILFSVINSLMNEIQFFNIFGNMLHNMFFIPSYVTNIISYFLQANLEISNGSKIITSLSINMELKLILLSFIIAFSGLAIIGQVSSIVGKTKINLKLYVFSKTCHGLFSSICCYVFLKINLFSIKTSTSTSSSSFLLNNEYVLLLVLLLLLMLFNIISVKLKFKKPN